jgi:hypothetical protein
MEVVLVTEQHADESNQWHVHAFRSHRPDSNNVMVDIQTPYSETTLRLPEGVAKSLHHNLREAIDDG